MSDGEKRAKPAEIITSVVKCFRDGVCIIDRRPHGFTIYTTGHEGKVSLMYVAERDNVLF